MSLARRAKMRDANEPAIVGALERVGVKIWRLDQPFDLLCWSSGRFWLCEVKNPAGKNRVSDSQAEFLAAFEDISSVPAYIVRSVDDAIRAAAEVGQWR